MPTETFLPQTVAEVPGIASTVFTGANGTEVAWTNPSFAVDEDGNSATCTFNAGTPQTPRVLRFSNLLSLSDGQPIASKIDAGATIDAIYAQVKCAISTGTSQSIRVRLYSAATLGVVGTQGFNSPAPTTPTLTWYDVTNGTVFGGAATTTDIRGTEFGFYTTLIGDLVLATVSVEAAQLVVTWTAGAPTASRPRRQIIRLPDGRIAAARARIR